MVLDNNNSLDNQVTIEYTYDTLMAFVDAVIPRTPMLAQVYGDVMYYGAVDFFTDEYLYMMLNEYTIPYTNLIAEILNIAAYRFLSMEGNDNRIYEQNRVYFAELPPEDRFRALSLFDQFDEYFSDFTIFQQYPGLVDITSSLYRFVILGYYSEWFGYGTTRLEEPNRREMQYDPLSWEQIGYPGPAISNIDFVNQYYTIRNTNIGLENT